MKFVNEVSVDAPADVLFDFLADVERVAPCLPGASVEHQDGDRYHGAMKVKVGPITGTYRGTMRFVELDRERRRAVMSARADEASGQGNAEAWIETTVGESGDSDGRSQLRLVTDLQLRGRVAQFGRGTVERIAQRMFSEFANNIEHQLAGAESQPQSGRDGSGAPADSAGGRSGDAAPAGEAAAPRASSEDESPPLDAVGLVAGPLVEKALPVLIPALIGFGYGYLLGRLRELTR
jgi:carbon monoxide dehydrogenase subunit G